MSTAAATPAAAAPAQMSLGEVLRVPVMRRLWYAQIVSFFGDFLALFAVISVLTFRLHATPAQVTGIQIAYLLPIAVLGILAGVFVDRWPLKPTMVASDLLRGCLCLLLVFAHTTWQFYAILAGISVFSSFFGPAQGVAIRSAVPLNGLRSANSLMQQVMFGMRIVGPSAAAFLVSSFGPNVCYFADSASFVASASLIASLTLIKPTYAAPDASPPDTEAPGSKAATPRSGLASILPDMRQGMNFILHHAALLFVILALAAGMFVIGCFGPLIAVYVRDSLHASTRFFGIASAMIGVGMFVGVNALNTAGKNIRNEILVYSGLLGISAGLCMLTLLTHMWSTILGNLIIGIAVAGIVVPSNTLIQMETPPALMGRVGSTTMSIVMAAQICGLLLSGQLAERIGVRHVFAWCAVLLVLLVAAGKLWMEPKPADLPVSP